MPPRKDSFGYGVTLPPITSRLVGAGADIRESEPERLDFLHAVMCQVGMPRRRQEARTFERRSGNVSLLIEAGRLWDGRAWREHPLPYGTRPRLAMVHVSSEAVRTQSPIVDMGNSVRDFLLRLGMDTSGKGYATFRRQMESLAACRLTLGMTDGERAVTVDAKPFRRFEAWLHPTGEQAVMWPGVLELSREYFETLVEHAVPLDYRALAALGHSALALDVYTWLAHRLHRVRKPDGVMVSWGNMRGQFGQEYANPKDFKRELRKALLQVCAVYPSARIEDVTGGILLKPSPPPVPKSRVMVSKRGAS